MVFICSHAELDVETKLYAGQGHFGQIPLQDLDDGLLNWLALKDDVMLSECAKLKPPRPVLRIGLSTGLPMAGWLIGFERLSSKMLTSQAVLTCE